MTETYGKTRSNILQLRKERDQFTNPNITTNETHQSNTNLLKKSLFRATCFDAHWINIRHSYESKHVVIQNENVLYTVVLFDWCVSFAFCMYVTPNGMSRKALTATKRNLQYAKHIRAKQSKTQSFSIMCSEKCLFCYVLTAEDWRKSRRVVRNCKKMW